MSWLLLWLACIAPEPPPPPPPTPTPVPTPVPVPILTTGEAPSGRYRARHLFVARGEGARARAEAVWRRVHAGADLAALARSESDEPRTARRDGLLGTFEPGTFAPALEAAVAAVDAGLGPLAETPDGFHVVERLALDEVVVHHLTWGWKGATRAAATRSREAALQLATEAVASLRSGTAPADLRADARSVPEGDRIGRRQWSADLEARAFALSPGEVSDPIDTPLGIVVLSRVE